MPIDILRDDATAESLGAALGTQYEPLRLLGRGGMGAVYLAREPFLDREVAIKVLPNEMAAENARERFLREARTAARLSHPNIVPLYTFGQAGDLLYYIMGYIDGESLETRLRREGRVCFDDARRIASELADALEYAHQMGVVHRDLKPDNVLLDRRTGRAMLTDFGIAKYGAAQETLTRTGVVVGTPHYMSPEQASGEREIDGRSDVYSLGVIAYRMVTGRLPFEGDLRHVLAQHATRPPTPPSQIVSGLPLDIDTAVTRALAKSPAERWPNARSMRDALSPTSDEALPDALRDISCGGVRLAIVSIALLELAFFSSIYDFGDPEVLIAMGVFTSVAGASGMIKAGRRYGWSAALRSWFAQPTWWKTWWPSFARRTGDVWDRVPREVRLTRALNGVAVAEAVAYFHVMFFTMRPSFLAAHPRYLLLGHIILPSGALVLGLFAVLGHGTFRFRRWAKRNGLSRSDAMRMTTESTFAHSFWQRPHIAALLSPAEMRPSSALTPRDIANELRTIARDAASSPQAALYAEAAAAAQAIASSVAAADDELAQLARDADPEEHSRIKTSLARTQEPQMRELLERQMELVTQLDRRQQDVRARRERLLAQLRTLSLHVAALRAQRATDAAAAAEITGRIHAICRGIDYHMEGIKETRQLVHPERSDGSTGRPTDPSSLRSSG